VHHPPTPVVDQPRCRSHRPPPAIEQPEWLLPGERVHTEITADAWRYLALDVPYDRRTLPTCPSCGAANGVAVGARFLDDAEVRSAVYAGPEVEIRGGRPFVHPTPSAPSAPPVRRLL